MWKDLPYEIHNLVIKRLFSYDVVQYSLVCKSWNKPATNYLFEKIRIQSKSKFEAFISAIAAFPQVGELVKSLDLTFNWLNMNYSNSIKQCSLLVQHTPNVKTLVSKDPSCILYKVVAHAVERGLWKNLSMVYDPLLFGKDPLQKNKPAHQVSSSYYDYYAILSTIQDKAICVVFNISHQPDVSLEPHCFEYPLFVTRETRFPKVERVTCHSTSTVAIQNLDEALKLCPAATTALLSFSKLEKCQPESIDVEPNTTVKCLRVITDYLTCDGLDYICRKFPNITRFILVFNQPASSTLTVDSSAISQLAKYISTIETVHISKCNFPTLMTLFDTLNKLAPQGSLEACFDESCLKLTLGKDKKSLMRIDPALLYPDLAGTNLACIEQVDKLILKPRGKTSYQQLLEPHQPFFAHCEQVRAFTIYRFALEDLITEMPSIESLYLQDCHIGPEFLNQCSKLLPNLKTIFIDHATFEEQEEIGDHTWTMDMPHTSFEAIYVTVPTRESVYSVYIELVRPDHKAYYRVSPCEFFSIEASEFEQPKPDVDDVKLTVVCKEVGHILVGAQDKLWFTHILCLHSPG
ncbi:hypothetical protein EDC96DRAFT_507229, partial [Choanephora cucurbitarum]